jgi:hypothetical protein
MFITSTTGIWDFTQVAAVTPSVKLDVSLFVLHPHVRVASYLSTPSKLKQSRIEIALKSLGDM